jgi:hypothetical protein
MAVEILLLYLTSYEHGRGNQYDKTYFIIVNVQYFTKFQTNWCLLPNDGGWASKHEEENTVTSGILCVCVCANVDFTIKN